MEITTLEGQKLVMEIAEQAAEKTADKVRGEIKELRTEIKHEMIPDVVKEVMTNLGQDVSNPHEAQADYQYLRKRRLRSETIEEWKVKGIVTAVVSTIVAALVAYFRSVGP